MEILLIVLFNLAVYARTIKYSVIVDDIRQYNTIKTGRASHTAFHHLSWNILDVLKRLWWDIKIRLYGAGTFGINPSLDHALSILLHTCLCVLIYMAFGYSKVSLMAALLYACHPSNHQTSIWLNGRRYILAIIFLMLMMVYKPWGFALYPFTFIFQYSAVFAPILLIKDYPWILIFIPFMVAWNWEAIKNKISVRMKLILCEEQKKVFTWGRIPIVIKSYGFYFYRMLAPWQTMMNYPDLYWWGIVQDKSDECYSLNLEFLRGVSAIVLSGLGLYYIPGNDKILWLFMILSTLQWSAILSAVQLNTDRYISLPNVFMMYFLAKAISFSPYSAVIFVGLMVYYCYNLSIVMRMYWSIDAYHRYQMYFQPQLTKPRFNRIEFYLKHNRMLTAWYLVEEGLQHNPNDFHFLMHSAICNATVGNLAKALEAIEQAEKNYYMGQEEHQSKAVKNMKATLENVGKQIHPHSKEKKKHLKRGGK
jgi:hypothetical protein